MNGIIYIYIIFYILAKPTWDLDKMSSSNNKVYETLRNKCNSKTWDLYGENCKIVLKKMNQNMKFGKTFHILTWEEFNNIKILIPQSKIPCNSN